MLKTIDILIGLTVVMLLLSMIVTVITQFVTTVLNSRGKHLQGGIADILEQIHPGAAANVRSEIARAVLLHPLVRDVNGKLGSVIHREELTKLLLELGSGEGPQKLKPEVKRDLLEALVANGVCKPGTDEEIQAQIRTILSNVRATALQLELAHPELTNAARARIALLQEASSHFVGKINSWFDQTIDRVSDRYTQHARVVTFCAGLLLALAIQLDTAALVSRLGSDDALRNSLVQQAGQLQPDDPKRNFVQDLITNNIVGVPLSFRDWTSRWTADNFVMKILGILLSSVLLSLGAPFWYNALQNLIRLRSLVASKDDQQRNERQLAGPTAKATAVAAAASEEGAILTDERGDLTLVG
jgi:hypothetical protein